MQKGGLTRNAQHHECDQIWPSLTQRAATCAAAFLLEWSLIQMKACTISAASARRRGLRGQQSGCAWRGDEPAIVEPAHLRVLHADGVDGDRSVDRPAGELQVASSAMIALLNELLTKSVEVLEKF